MGGYSRRTFITGSTALGAASVVGRAGPAHAAGEGRCNLLVVAARGGWDTAYALDPKPGSPLVDSPAGMLASYGGLDIFVDASRPAVTEFFDAYAQITALVRGINVRTIVHPECMRRMLTGSPARGNSDMGAISGFELGTDLPVPYLVLGPESFPGPLTGITASVGFTKQLAALLDPTQAYPLHPSVGVADLELDGASRDSMRDWLNARVERERATRGARGYNKRRIDDFGRSLDSAKSLRRHADAIGKRAATLVTAEKLSVAIDAIESGLSWSVLCSDDQLWDTHTLNDPQGTYQDNLFRAVKTALDELSNRPGKRQGNTLLDETVVVVLSEMTRTPRLNGTNGKDHWPVAAALVIGAGVDGGNVVGGTSDGQDALPVDLATGVLDDAGEFISTGSFVAGVLELVGVDPSKYLSETPLGGLKA